MLEFIEARTNGDSNYDSHKVVKKYALPTSIEKPKDRFILHFSSYSSPHHVSKFEASGPQKKVGKENRQHASVSSGKGSTLRVGCKGSMSQDLSCFCLSVCTKRLIKFVLQCQNHDALRRAFWGLQTSQNKMGEIPANCLTAYSANLRRDEM